jgi:hypothetical protein
MEGPPLWVWAVIVGAVVAAKFALRWARLRRLTRLVGRKTNS